MREFFHSVDKLKPVYDKVYQFVMFVCKLLLVADILITCMSVVGRYVSFIPDPAWSEEVVLTCMSYMAVLSAALAIRQQCSYPYDGSGLLSSGYVSKGSGYSVRSLCYDSGNYYDRSWLEVCGADWRKRHLCKYAVRIQILDVFSGSFSRYCYGDF